jgi:hypothetical protein
MAVMATERRSQKPHPKELATPPAAPVPWRIVRLRGKRTKVPHVVARTWFEARGIAMVTYGVESGQVEIEPRTK